MFNLLTSLKTQADGAWTALVDDGLLYHQIQVEVSATPSTGTLAVAVRATGAVAFVTLDGTFDLTSANLVKTFGPMFIAEIKFTPANFDAGKTYNVSITSGGKSED